MKLAENGQRPIDYLNVLDDIARMRFKAKQPFNQFV